MHNSANAEDVSEDAGAQSVSQPTKETWVSGIFNDLCNCIYVLAVQLFEICFSLLRCAHVYIIIEKKLVGQQDIYSFVKEHFHNLVQLNTTSLILRYYLNRF